MAKPPKGNDALADVQKRVALAGVVISPALLIADLGVPLRFINMLRVFESHLADERGLLDSRESR